MTFEARIGFILVFVIIWAVIGTIPWAVAAIRMRGRGALHLLPLVVLSAVLAGIIVPLAGARGITGFWVSLLTALAGALIASSAGVAFLPRVLGLSEPPPRSPPPARAQSTDAEERRG